MKLSKMSIIHWLGDFHEECKTVALSNTALFVWMSQPSTSALSQTALPRDAHFHVFTSGSQSSESLWSRLSAAQQKCLSRTSIDCKLTNTLYKPKMTLYDNLESYVHKTIKSGFWDRDVDSTSNLNLGWNSVFSINGRWGECLGNQN